MRLQLIAITLASIAASCCTPAPPEPAEDTSASAAMPEIDINALGVPLASVPDAGLLCAGQISPEQMDALHAAGFETFVSLRVAGENGAGWEEAHAATAGVTFQRLPVAGAAGVTSENARELREILESAEGPTVLYCGSSNRVGALLGIAAHEIDGKSAEEALAYARSAGLTGLEPVFNEVVGR